MDPRDFPAFPAYSIPTGEDHANGEPEPTRNFPGMPLRDYFAAKAMQGWIASYPTNTTAAAAKHNAHLIADFSYAIADAMMEARKA